MNMNSFILFVLCVFSILLACLYYESQQHPYKEGLHFGYSVRCINGYKYRFNINTETPILERNGEPMKCDESIEITEIPDNSTKKVTTDKVELTKEYIEKYKEMAITEQAIYGILASIILAQGVLETNAGQSDLCKKHNNHFGMKWNKGRKETYAVYADDSPTDKFVVYESSWWSYRDHSKLLITMDRYKPCFKCRNDYKCWAKSLKAAGYATDKKYAEKLISIIEQYELYKYDK